MHRCFQNLQFPPFLAIYCGFNGLTLRYKTYTSISNPEVDGLFLSLLSGISPEDYKEVSQSTDTSFLEPQGPKQQISFYPKNGCFFTFF